MNLDIKKQNYSFADNQFWKMAAIVIIITIVMAGLLFYATQKYVLQRAENKIQDLLLAHKGIHHYVQCIMHPAFYKYKEKGEVCNAIGSHHDEVEMTTLLAPIVQVCDAISGARPGARREVVESHIKRLKELEAMALSYPGVLKTYAIQAGRELRVIVGSEKVTDKDAESLSFDIAKKIQDEMTYPGQVKITVIRETRAVNYAK